MHVFRAVLLIFTIMTSLLMQVLATTPAGNNEKKRARVQNGDDSESPFYQEPENGTWVDRRPSSNHEYALLCGGNKEDTNVCAVGPGRYGCYAENLLARKTPLVVEWCEKHCICHGEPRSLD